MLVGGPGTHGSHRQGQVSHPPEDLALPFSHRVRVRPVTMVENVLSGVAGFCAVVLPWLVVQWCRSR